MQRPSAQPRVWVPRPSAALNGARCCPLVVSARMSAHAPPTPCMCPQVFLYLKPLVSGEAKSGSGGAARRGTSAPRWRRRWARRDRAAAAAATAMYPWPGQLPNLAAGRWRASPAGGHAARCGDTGTRLAVPGASCSNARWLQPSQDSPQRPTLVTGGSCEPLLTVGVARSTARNQGTATSSQSNLRTPARNLGSLTLMGAGACPVQKHPLRVHKQK